MNKQNKRAKTLIEYMGFKDPDLYLPDHDTWCLKLLNKELIEKIILTRLLDKKFKEKFGITKHDAQKIIYKVRNETTGNTVYGLNPNKYSHHTSIEKEIKNPQIYQENSIEVEKPILEYVIVKHGNNGFSQRLGFIDICCNFTKLTQYYIEVDGKRENIQFDKPELYVICFEVKTSIPSIGSITREIEYYRDALKETTGRKVIPLVITKEKIPIDQFKTITFDEILEMEKELESK